jgi:LuxR family transcriptional regulator, maltose regulon positive regulatory protein
MALVLIEDAAADPSSRGLGFRDGIVPRDRLLDDLRRAADLPVVLVTAGAGYGKTTLLSQWVDADARASAWISVTGHHDDPVSLLEDVLDGLHRIEPFDARTRRGLLASQADFTSVRVPRLVRALSTRSVPFMLVFDDLHHLESPLAWELVRGFVDHVPAGSQVVVASREHAPLPVARMLADRRLFMLDAGDLTMTVAEGCALLEASGVDVGDERAELLVEQTEGWPVGLYLASLVIRARGEEDPDPFFAGDDQLVAEYLRDELLQALSDDTRDFLLRTSILERMSGDLCDAVLGRTDSTQMLDRAARSNLLVFSTDRRREWFRSHHLLRDLLRFELHRRDPAVERELHQRASEWFEAQGDLDSAIRHAIDARDDARVDALVWQAASFFLGVGRSATVGMWLARCTTEQIASRPPLLAIAGIHAFTIGNMGELEYWARAASEFDGHADLPGGVPVAAAAALLRAIVAKDGLAAMRDDAALAYALDRTGSAYRSVACFVEGSAWRLLGEPTRARECFSEGAVIGAKLVPSSQVNCLSGLAMLAVDADDWPAASTLVAEALRVVDQFELPERPATTGVFAVSALVHARIGDSDRAGQDLKQSMFLLSMLSTIGPWMGIECRILLARAALLLGDQSLARVLCAEAVSLLERVPDSELQRARLHDVERAVDADSIPLSLTATPMTPAELRVLRYLPTHLTFAAIADELFVSRNTVKTQAISIYRKLGVTSRGPAVDAARQLGLLEH